MSYRSFYSPVSRAAYRQALQDRLKGTANIVPYEHILTATITPTPTDPAADTAGEMELGTSHSGSGTSAVSQAPIDPATLSLVRDVYRAEDLQHLTSAPLKFNADWTSVADYTGGVADYTRPKTDLKADYKIQCLDSYLEDLTREMHSKVQLYNQRLYPQGTTIVPTTTNTNTNTNIHNNNNTNIHLLTSHSNFESATQRSLSNNLVSSDFDDITLLESIFDINTLTSTTLTSTTYTNTYTNTTTTTDCIIDSLLIPHQKYGSDFFPSFSKESKRRGLYTHQDTYHNILKLRALYGIQTIETAQNAIRYM